MRCAAGAGFLVLVGCNQVFGIQKTEPYDAAPDVQPDRSFVTLTWRVADVLASGAPDPLLVDAPIEPAPTVRYAALGQPFTSAVYASDGTVTIPRELFPTLPDDAGTRPVEGSVPNWRFEYTLAGGVPHEVQWAPSDKQGQLTVPLFGRVDRKPVPVGGGYTFTPRDAPVSFKDPRVFTTGQWSEGLIPSYAGDGATIDYDFFNAAAMSGSRGRPEPSLGDHAYLIDYGSNAAGCRIATGSAALDSAAIEPGKRSLPVAGWDGSTRRVSSETVSFATQDRLINALGPLHQDPSLTGTVSLGIATHAQMPPLTGVTPSPLLPVATALPTPVMITVLQCPFNFTSLPPAAQPQALDGFPRVLHVQLVSRRTVQGVALTSGLETALASTSSEGFRMTFPAAMPTKILLAPQAGPKIALDGLAEELAVGPATSAFTLDFTPEPGEPRPDYYDITLHELDLDAQALVARRIYTVTEPHVEIAGATLTPGTLYVFEIRSFKGHPDADAADFRTVSFPYGSGILFTRTFRAS